MVELCWWESALPVGICQYVLDIDEQQLEKLELALANDPTGHLEQGLFKVRLVHQEPL